MKPATISPKASTFVNIGPLFWKEDITSCLCVFRNKSQHVLSTCTPKNWAAQKKERNVGHKRKQILTQCIFSSFLFRTWSFSVMLHLVHIPSAPRLNICGKKSVTGVVPKARHTQARGITTYSLSIRRSHVSG
jgi:hypothetical protein